MLKNGKTTIMSIHSCHVYSLHELAADVKVEPRNMPSNQMFDLVNVY